MADQTARQQARRAAVGEQAKMRARRAERERRRDALGLEVVTALAERDAVAAACEARAGAALAKMTGEEGLTLSDAVAWCGSADLTVREATRLRQGAKDSGGGDKPEPARAGGDKAGPVEGAPASVMGGARGAPG